MKNYFNYEIPHIGILHLKGNLLGVEFNESFTENIKGMPKRPLSVR